MSASDRRRSPRLDARGRVRGQLLTLDLPVVVRDLSLGGMSIETAFPLDVGAEHEFRLELTGGFLILVTGEVRHCRRVAPAGKAATYVSGIQFVAQPIAEAVSTIADLLDTLK